MGRGSEVRRVMVDDYCSWDRVLSDCAGEVELALRAVSESRDRGAAVFPEPELIFRALKLTPLDSVRVVVLGQDPYHGRGQADGLAFSCSRQKRAQPSLANVLREYRDDLGYPEPSSPDLSAWAERGVLLLNSALTVEESKPKSHSDAWRPLAAKLLRAAADRGVHVVLMGGAARKLAEEACGELSPDSRAPWLLGLGETPSTAQSCAHPSPLSAHSGFFGSKIFSRANVALQMRGLDPVDWRLP